MNDYEGLRLSGTAPKWEWAKVGMGRSGDAPERAEAEVGMRHTEWDLGK